MRYRQLGRSGLFVSEICLGAMTFGGGSGGIWSMIGDLDQQAVNAVMARRCRAASTSSTPPTSTRRASPSGWSASR